MLQQHYKEVRSRLVLTAIFITSVMYGTTMGSYLPKAGDQDQDWNAIIRLHKQGQEALAAEKSNPKDANLKIKRQAVFAQASTALTDYIAKYLSDQNTITYLRAIYRLGNYLELAGSRSLAVDFYYSCLKHLLVGTKEAVYDGKPISQLATARLNAAKSFKTTSGGESSHISPAEQDRIRKLIGKGLG